MQVVSVKAILKTESNGTRTWVGWAEESTPVPEGLQTGILSAIDMQDASGERWLLISPTATPLFDEAALVALGNGECSRIARSKLSDKELAELGLSR